MNCEENSVGDIENKANNPPEEKKACSYSVIKDSNNSELNVNDVSGLPMQERSLELEDSGSKQNQAANIPETLSKDNSKPGNSNGYSTGSSTKKGLTNKRMSVPLQKKPKKTFEEALFGSTPVVHTKRPSTEEKTLSKTSKNFVQQVTHP